MSAQKQGPPCLKGGGPEGRGDTNPCPPNPCRGCDHRHSHCHADCEPYLEFYRWHRAENDRRHRAQDADQMKITGVMKARAFARRLKGKRHK